MRVVRKRNLRTVTEEADGTDKALQPKVTRNGATNRSYSNQQAKQKQRDRPPGPDR